MTSLSFFIYFTVLWISASANNKLNENEIIWTKYGQIRGSVLRSRFGRAFYSFQGIPYAKPPVGNLRFKAPEEPDRWEGVFNATKDGEQCIQKNYLFEGMDVTGSEDCLYLNVYTPRVNGNGELMPVMVYIHGGGWFTGSNSIFFSGPEYFMDEDIVLVLMNYRLAVMGFLSTGDDIAPGNWALKDQLAALRWVQENIQNFSGNPNSVTIFGQSAGGASVHYHMLSSLSKGLFHRAITESGVSLNLWAKPMNALNISRQQARFVNCPDDDIKRMIDCLRNVDAKELVRSGDKFKFWSVDPLVVYSPAIEIKTAQNLNPYLEDDPYKLLHAKNIANRVPWIVGVVSDEATIRAAKLISNDTLRNEINKRFEELVPKLFELDKSVSEANIDELFRNMTDFYMDSEVEINKNTSQGFFNMYSDRGFSYPIYQSALLHMEAGYTPIYFYYFAYKGVYSYGPIFSGSKDDFGVGHCDDLIYLFRTPVLFPDLPLDHPDVIMSKKFVNLWTTFAKYGTPNSPNGKSEEVIWPSLPNLNGKKATNSDLKYLSIINSKNDNKMKKPYVLEVKNSFYTKRMEFWASLPLEQNKIKTD